MKLSLLGESIKDPRTYNIKVTIAIPTEKKPRGVGAALDLIHNSIVKLYGQYLKKSELSRNLLTDWDPKKPLNTHRLFVKYYGLNVPINVNRQGQVGNSHIVVDIRTIPPE